MIISNLLVIKDKSTLLYACIYSEVWEVKKRTDSFLTPRSSANAFPRGRWGPTLLQAFKASTWDAELFLPITCSTHQMLSYGGRVDLEPTYTDILIWLKVRDPGPKCNLYEPQLSHIAELSQTLRPIVNTFGESQEGPTKHTPYQIYLVRKKSGGIVCKDVSTWGPEAPPGMLAQQFLHGRWLRLA